ncbi:hypothetical protein EVAR_37028_1 [Eumeta japonica]|uniref:Uncharacterized protein n=1 Tax=Eumeta variegata TaxID=151549 RepID=A0A4C1WIM5_EUMVA|nr:hypothetical protein EVAR_37028_1 [Eumeta japonica]
MSGWLDGCPNAKGTRKNPVVLKPLSLYNGPLWGDGPLLSYTRENNINKKKNYYTKKGPLEKTKLKGQEKIANESHIHKWQRLEKIRCQYAASDISVGAQIVRRRVPRGTSATRARLSMRRRRLSLQTRRCVTSHVRPTRSGVHKAITSNALAPPGTSFSFFDNAMVRVFAVVVSVVPPAKCFP